MLGSRPGGSGPRSESTRRAPPSTPAILSAAVTAAESALREADEAPAPGIVEVIEPARPLLNRVFTTYIGPSTGLPILAPRADEIARQRLDDRERALLRRIDAAAHWKGCSTVRASVRWTPCASSRG